MVFVLVTLVGSGLGVVVVPSIAVVDALPTTPGTPLMLLPRVTTPLMLLPRVTTAEGALSSAAAAVAPGAKGAGAGFPSSSFINAK